MRRDIHVHGGIGFTWQRPAQLRHKLAQSSRLLLGDPMTLVAELIYL